jgi:hypothetical protein
MTGAPTAGHGADCHGRYHLGCRLIPQAAALLLCLVFGSSRIETGAGNSPMDRLIIALWISLALVGLGILALFEGWLLPDG